MFDLGGRRPNPEDLRSEVNYTFLKVHAYYSAVQDHDGCQLRSSVGRGLVLGPLLQAEHRV